MLSSTERVTELEQQLKAAEERHTVALETCRQERDAVTAEKAAMETELDSVRDSKLKLEAQLASAQAAQQEGTNERLALDATVKQAEKRAEVAAQALAAAETAHKEEAIQMQQKIQEQLSAHEQALHQQLQEAAQAAKGKEAVLEEHIRSKDKEVCLV